MHGTVVELTLATVVEFTQFRSFVFGGVTTVVELTLETVGVVVGDGVGKGDEENGDIKKLLLTVGCVVPVSYTHLTLPTICSV